jgi:Tfp pilus assembly protein PilX
VTHPRRRLTLRDDKGAALITTLFMVAVLSALAVTVTVISTNNVGNAGRDRQGTAALALSEGGVAQAVAYIRNGSAIRNLRCAPNCGTANPWGEQPVARDGDSAPAQTVTIATGETYEVWIEPIQALDVSTFQPGIYRVHSKGISAGNPGNRTVEVDLEVSPFKYPLAVYADTVNPGGAGSIFNESLFSTGCIFKRDKINFGTGLDVVYGVPPAAHSSQYITESQGSGSACSASDNKNIHHADNATNGCSTDVDYQYDQDKQGLNPVAAPCYGKYTAGTTVYPKTSLISDDNDLKEQWDFQLEGLTAEQLELLKTSAIEQGFYFTDTVAIPTVLRTEVTAAAYPNPILFYDLAGSAVGQEVDLNDLAAGYSRTWPLSADSSSCTGRSAFVIVKNGNVGMNANSVLTASVFAMGPAPYGNVSKLNGTGQLIGTLYGRQIDLTGTGDVKLDECFVENPPGQALEVRITEFVEVDRDRVAINPTATATP